MTLCDQNLRTDFNSYEVKKLKKLEAISCTFVELSVKLAEQNKTAMKNEKFSFTLLNVK